MADDLVSSLTRQVREEVIEHYLTERRLIGYQIEEIEKRAEDTRFRALKTGRRLNRLAYLMIHPEMLRRLLTLLAIPSTSSWTGCIEDKKPSQRIRFIRVRALTDRAKFRKLVFEAYLRFYKWMDKYRKSYEDLDAECRAVNANIREFQQNFDLLAILNFLRSLDTQALELKQILGENFTPAEMASIDRKLYFKPMACDKLDVPEPLSLPQPEAVEEGLAGLAQQIYQKHQSQVKHLMR